MSPIVPGETIHCHQGMDQSYSTRIRRFNLGLIELSEATGVSIIDVDSLVARKGADALKLDAIHLTPPGYQLIAEEVVRVLEDLGVLNEGKS
jgi:lysophospholipase L1-like esterase